MNMNLSKALAPLGLLLVVGLLGYLLVIPGWTDLSDKRGVLDAAGKQNQNLNTQLKEIDSFLAKYEANKDIADTTNLALPIGANIESVLADLDTLAAQSGVALSDIVIAETAPGQKQAQYSIGMQKLTLVASGTYPAFKNLLLLMETNLRIIDIDAINFQVNEDNNNQTEYQLGLIVYYQN